MEETLYDPNRAAIAYIAYNDEKTIYLWDGTPAAYIDNGNHIYGFNGQHLGWYEEGIAWDLKGLRVGFNRKALPVFAKFEPFKAFKQFKPFKAFKQFASTKPFKQSGYSYTPLAHFLMAGAR